jgi:hypothetical protein
MQQIGKVAVKGYFPQANDDANSRESLNLAGKVGGTVSNLLGLRLITGWSTPDDGGDPGVAQFQAVVAMNGAWFGGEAKLVQDGVHEVAGAVAGEGSAGSIGAMGTRCEAENEDASAGISKAWNGATPVSLVLVGSTSGVGDATTVIA